MPKKKDNTALRKKDHIRICLEEEVSFRNKTNGFDKYEFDHFAPTEVKIDKIDFSTDFFGKRISYPFIISCMTGGTFDAVDINRRLAVAAEELKIPIGVGSQRQAVENSDFAESFQVIRRKAPTVPVFGNIGAAQITHEKEPWVLVQKLVDMIQADAFVIHLNPLQELFQKGGESDFTGLLKAIENICRNSSIPVIVKEVGSGISGKAAKHLLECGVKGIDVAGAGGTSWSAVEMIRNKNHDADFRDWGLPTSYCIKEVNKLKKDFSFILIASGGINSGFETAKSLALGADMAASARIVLKEVVNNGSDGVIKLIENWFDTVRKAMYLTGSQDLESFTKSKLIKKEELF
jgi:isopentenyl-diphosphate Delta-isomerase